MLGTARNAMKMSHRGLSLFEKIKEIKNDMQSILILFYELKSGHIGDTLWWSFQAIHIIFMCCIGKWMHCPICSYTY